MRWTENQKKAIEYRGGNLLIAAGAGAGKTGVLSRRIIARLEEGHSIDSLLVLTFTRAAAKEMRDRIRKNLYEHMEADPAGRKHFRRQLMLLPDAPITTLHSFCLLLLRRHFNLLPGLDPKFKILDPDQAKVMRDDLLRDFFERQYLDADIHRRDRFLRLLRSYGDRLSDEGLKTQMLHLLEFGQSEGDVAAWTGRALALFQDRAFWRKEALAAMDKDLAAAKEIFLDALAYCESAGGPGRYAEILQGDIAYVDALLAMDWQERGAVEPFFARLSGKKKSDDPQIAERVKKRRDSGKAMVKKTLALAAAEESEEVHGQIAADLAYLVELTLAFETEYQNHKRKKGWMEFSDLEQSAYHLLRDNPALAEEYRRRFTEIFIDEYQDINGLQSKILSYLSNGGNLFMVGDVKQSIYGFRGANHRLFQQLYETFGYPAANDKGLLLTLNDNFRSRPAILSGVNFIFSQIMTAEAVDIAYDEKAALQPGRGGGPQEGPAIEFLFVAKRQEDEVDGDYDYPEKALSQARAIGGRIEDIMASGQTVEENGVLRPVTYGDFAILLRSDKGRIRIMEDALKERGIAVEASGDSGQGQEIRVLMALLAVLDNPLQDIPLAALLRSPLFHFDEEELMTVAKREKGQKLWPALHREFPSPLAEKAGAFLQTIAKWRGLSLRHGVGDLLLYIMEESDYQAFWSALPNGRQRVQNIITFQERALAFQEQQMGGIFAFLRYVERLEGSAGGEGVVGRGDAVKIITMHKAKGLEFPIVFLADLGRKLNREESKAPLSLDRNLGFGPKVKDWALRIRYPSLAKHIIDREKRKAGIAEEMRVLYVALTRAKEKLFLVAEENAKGKWQELFDSCRFWPGQVLSRGDVVSVSSQLQWLAMAFGRHRTFGGTLSSPYCDFSVALTEIAAPGPYVPVPKEAGSAGPSLPLERLHILGREEAAFPLPRKVTVTELLSREEVPKRPAFLQDGALTGAEQGTAFHCLMAALPLHREWSLPALVSFEDELEERGILSSSARECLDNQAVLFFLQSPYGAALRKSPVIRREMAFTAGFPANQLFPVESGETILLQGAVDLLFQTEEGAWFLLDYKHMALRDKKAFLQTYQRQLFLYCRAVEKLYNIKIQEGAFYVTKAQAFVPGYPSP